jgi:hypothetical protein
MSFYVTGIQVERLQVMSKKSGLAASEIIRRGIDEPLEKYKEK